MTQLPIIIKNNKWSLFGRSLLFFAMAIISFSNPLNADLKFVIGGFIACGIAFIVLAILHLVSLFFSYVLIIENDRIIYRSLYWRKFVINKYSIDHFFFQGVSGDVSPLYGGNPDNYYLCLYLQDHKTPLSYKISKKLMGANYRFSDADFWLNISSAKISPDNLAKILQDAGYIYRPEANGQV